MRIRAFSLNHRRRGSATDVEAVGAIALVQRGRAVLLSELTFVPGASLAAADRLARRTLAQTAPVVAAMHIFE